MKTLSFPAKEEFSVQETFFPDNLNSWDFYHKKFPKDMFLGYKEAWDKNVKFSGQKTFCRRSQ